MAAVGSDYLSNFTRDALPERKPRWPGLCREVQRAGKPAKLLVVEGGSAFEGRPVGLLLVLVLECARQPMRNRIQYLLMHRLIRDHLDHYLCWAIFGQSFLRGAKGRGQSIDD